MLETSEETSDFAEQVIDRLEAAARVRLDVMNCLTLSQYDALVRAVERCPDGERRALVGAIRAIEVAIDPTATFETAH